MAVARSPSATAGRAVFFSGLTVLLGLLGPGPVRVHGPALGRDRRRDRRGLAVAAALTLLPALLAILGPRIDALRDVAPLGVDRHEPPTAKARGRVSPVASWTDRSPSSSRPSLILLVLGTPFLHVRFNAPDAIDPAGDGARRAAPSTVSSQRVRRGRVRAAVAGGPHDRPGDRARPTSACSTTTRARSPPTHASPASRASSTSIRGCASTQYQLIYSAPGRPRAIASSQTRWRGHDARRSRRRSRVYTPYGPNRDEARQLVADLRDPRGALAPPAGVTRAGRRRRGRGRGRRRPDRRRLPADGAVHPDHDLPRAVRAAALGRPAGQGAGHEQPLDHRQLRRAGLDLPGRQPVRAARLPAARVRRDDPAGDPVLRPLRAVDGLRGLPARRA